MPNYPGTNPDVIRYFINNTFYMDYNVADLNLTINKLPASTAWIYEYGLITNAQNIGISTNGIANGNATIGPTVISSGMKLITLQGILRTPAASVGYIQVVNLGLTGTIAVLRGYVKLERLSNILNTTYNTIAMTPILGVAGDDPGLPLPPDYQQNFADNFPFSEQLRDTGDAGV